MNPFKSTLSLIALCVSAMTLAAANEAATVRILLMGDSTTIGGSPLFEDSIEKLLFNEPGIASVEAINVGLGGETAYSLINSGRYERDIAGLTDIDYIFFRYGINDWFTRQPFAENFPSDVVAVLDRLREDFPDAEIVLMTILPFMRNVSQTITVNNHIKQIAQDEGLELFDIYPSYYSKVQEFGENALNVRFFALDEIPQRYHKLLEPYTQYYSWKGAEWVTVQSNEFDPILGHLPNWYQDRHPNNAGYILLADETVKFLLQKFDPPVSKWAPYDVDEAGWINTGSWMSWLNISLDPWIWSDLFKYYIYIPINNAPQGGIWGFFPKQ